LVRADFNESSVNTTKGIRFLCKTTHLLQLINEYKHKQKFRSVYTIVIAKSN
jgi:hypothetical protein